MIPCHRFSSELDKRWTSPSSVFYFFIPPIFNSCFTNIIFCTFTWMNHSAYVEWRKAWRRYFYSNLIERAKAVLFGLWIDDVYPQRLPEVFIQKSIPIKGKLWMWIEYEPFQRIFFIMFNLNSMSIYIKFYLYYVIFFETSTGLIKKGWGH